MDFPATFAEARARLTARPVGRTPLGIRSLRFALDEELDALDATAGVDGDMLVGLALDAPLVDVAVTEEMLKQWGVTFEQALAGSFEVHGDEHPAIEHVEGVTLVTDRSFAAYLLTHPAAAQGLVSGTPVALVPTDEHVVLGAQEDEASLVVAAGIADTLLQRGGRVVSASALIGTADAWQSVGVLPVAHQFALRFATLVYGGQRPLLQAFYDRSAQDCLVAEAVMARRPDGVMQLVATLTEGVATALPAVDAVSLVRETGIVGMVPMTQLLDEPGLLSPLPDLDPPRWFASRFPAEFVA